MRSSRRRAYRARSAFAHAVSGVRLPTTARIVWVPAHTVESSGTRHHVAAGAWSPDARGSNGGPACLIRPAGWDRSLVTFPVVGDWRAP